MSCDADPAHEKSAPNNTGKIHQTVEISSNKLIFNIPNL